MSTLQPWDAWIERMQGLPQPLVDDSVLVNYAASAGASSRNFTMAVAVATLKTRRILYAKRVPGDCGTAGFNLSGSSLATVKVAAGLGTAARLDPEPLSKAILTGIDSIVSIFGAHHAAAVRTEQETGCSVSTAFNEVMVQLEQGVKQGALSPNDAQQALTQAASALDAELQTIFKECNTACGMRISIKAMQSYCRDIVWPALAPSVNIPFLTSFLASPAEGSPGAPGTIPGNAYRGASGYTPSPLNANNPGSGPSSIPENLTPGTILIIGGVAFVASKL